MATFTWIPDFPPRLTEDPRARVTKFGDGYEQRSIDGVNPINKTWSLTFGNRDNSEATAIVAFLRARQGIEAFDWTDPDGVAGKYVCRKWYRDYPNYNINTVTVDFERVYE